MVYEDQGTEKVTYISNCKKFHEKLVGVEEETPPPGDAIPKQKKQVNLMNCQKVLSSRRKMTLYRFEVHVGGMTHAFDGPDRFLLWLQGEEDASADICAQEDPARGGMGSQEVTDFCQELSLPKLPGRWQKRTL